MRCCLLFSFASFVMFLSSLGLLGDTITIHNKTNAPVYAAPYYKRGASTTRCGDIHRVEPGLSVHCERPSYKTGEYEDVSQLDDSKFWHDRKLYIARRSLKLKDILTPTDRKRVTSQSIGLTSGSHFYIAEVNGRLKGFNAFEWTIVQPIAQAAGQLVDETIQAIQNSLKKTLPAVRHNRYKKVSAAVRCGNQLCDQERSYRALRKKHVKHALEKIVGRSIEADSVPTISIVASGGGFRAMLATIGSLYALEQLGLLDAVTYISSLSGSTWAVGSWFSYGGAVASFKDNLLPFLAPGLLPLTPKEIKYFMDTLLVKWSFDQLVTPVDFYGALVGNRLLKQFGKLRHRTYLSEQAALLKEGRWPLPIYTAIRSDFRTQQEWYEFTPYEIGGAWLGHYVPSWAYGRRFESGQSVDFAPEQSLSAHFGVFGSAFAVTFNRMYAEIEDSISCNIIKKVIERIMKEIGNQRLANSCFHNFTYGLSASPIAEHKHIELADAGIDFNLPYPPISQERPERASDIIIFLDSSATIKGIPELKKVASYAQRHGLPFPPLADPNIDKQAITVLRDDHNPNCPVVVYVPWVQDMRLWNEKKYDPHFKKFVPLLNSFDPEKCMQLFCSTYNFEYNMHQANQVAALSEFNMLADKYKLIEVIDRFITSGS